MWATPVTAAEITSAARANATARFGWRSCRLAPMSHAGSCATNTATRQMPCRRSSTAAPSLPSPTTTEPSRYPTRRSTPRRARWPRRSLKPASIRPASARCNRDRSGSSMPEAAAISTSGRAPDRSHILRCHHLRTLAGRFLRLLFELRLEPTLEQAIEAVEVYVDDRRDVERKQLREDQSADHRDAERLAQFGAGAVAERDRQRPEDRRECRHHDRPEAQHGGFADRRFRAHADSPAFDREVDHHDRILLDDANQHHDADHGDDGEIHVEGHKRDQGADAGRREAGNNRDRMDEALVEDAKQHIGPEHRRQDQYPLPFQRLLEYRRRALKPGGNARRQTHLALDI